MQTSTSDISNVLKPIALLLLALALGFGLSLSENQNILIIGVGLLFSIIVAFIILRSPVNGLKTILIISFVLIGIKRYMLSYIDFPVGVIIDYLILLTFVAFLIHNKNKVKWDKNMKGLIFMLFIWFIYAILQFFNPNSISPIAWLLATRGLAVYLFAIPILTFLVFNKSKYLDFFIKTIGVFAILGGLKGLGQIYIGLDPVEQIWFDNFGRITHLVWGQVRAFSFYSDAAVFGDFQSFTMVLFSILLFSNPKASKELKAFYVTVILFSVSGLILSGTRGAVYIPFVAMFLYGLIRKGMLAFLITLLTVMLLFGFLNYTNIGQSYSKIARVRSAFNYKDRSFQVRVKNQRLLWDYLQDKPFGGGAGTTSYYGKKYAADTFLANTPPDSYFVRVWAEYGIVGIVLLLGIIAYILIAGAFVIYHLRESEFKLTILALWASLGGLFFVNLGNDIFAQFPIIIIISIAIGFIFSAQQIQPEIEKIND